MTNRLIALSLLGLSCSGCLMGAAPVAAGPSNNPNVEVETLFTHDGCTVFRFSDLGYHYYARCDGAHPSVATMSTVSCGRHCEREEEIGTVAAQSNSTPPPAAAPN